MKLLPDFPELPDLQIVSCSALQPHERVDEQRAVPLVERMEEEAILRNPPVVIPAGDRAERFVVLDGANRTEAMRLMGLPHALVQVVHAGGTTVQLKTWNHVVTEIATPRLVEVIEGFPEIALIPSDEERATFNLSAGGTLATLVLPGGKVLEVVGETAPPQWSVRNPNRLVDSYQSISRVERISQAQTRGLERLYPGFAGMIVFRPFEIEEAVTAAATGLLLPAGLTRFVISPRALRVDYPLELLAKDEPLEMKRQALGEWLRQRIGGSTSASTPSPRSFSTSEARSSRDQPETPLHVLRDLRDRSVWTSGPVVLVCLVTRPPLVRIAHSQPKTKRDLSAFPLVERVDGGCGHGQSAAGRRRGHRSREGRSGGCGRDGFGL